MTDVTDLQAYKSDRGDVSPLAALKKLVADIEAGECKEPFRMVIVTEADNGKFDVYASGWPGNDVIPALGLLDAARLTFYDIMTDRR